MVTTGYSGAQTTRTGAYDPNAAGNSVVRGTLFDQVSALCSTATTLGHVGTYRVKARIWPSATDVRVRLTWQEGDGPFRSNPWATPPTSQFFSEVDLGLVTIPPKQLGTQKWSGRIEAYTDGTSGTDTLDVDHLVLVPAAEGYGKARSALAVQFGPLVGQDNFDSMTAAAVLNARSSPLGGTWATSGAATDLVASTPAGSVVRSTTSDGSNRFAILGASTYTDTDVRVDFTTTAFSSGSIAGGPTVRWIDANNYAKLYPRGAASGPFLQVVVGGVVVVACSVSLNDFTPAPWKSPPRTAHASSGAKAQTSPATSRRASRSAPASVTDSQTPRSPSRAGSTATTPTSTCSTTSSSTAPTAPQPTRAGSARTPQRQRLHSMSVVCAGWMAHTRDRKFQEIYVDQDPSHWQEADAQPSCQRSASISRRGLHRLTDGGVTFAGPAARRSASSDTELMYVMPVRPCDREDDVQGHQANTTNVEAATAVHRRQRRDLSSPELGRADARQHAAHRHPGVAERYGMLRAHGERHPHPRRGQHRSAARLTSSPSTATTA
jgi:hypothetical protein